MQKNPYNYRKLQEAFRKQNRPRITRDDIAKATGMSTAYVDKVICGERFKETAVFAVADFLGVPREELLTHMKTKRSIRKSA